VRTKCPGSEREEYKEVLVPTLIAVHPENDLTVWFSASRHMQWLQAGGHKGVIKIFFVAKLSRILWGANHTLRFVANRFYLCFKNGSRRN
jgi:hypothetical protein